VLIYNLVPTRFNVNLTLVLALAVSVIRIAGTEFNTQLLPLPSPDEREQCHPGASKRFHPLRNNNKVFALFSGKCLVVFLSSNW
jgi:hypothetical protein